MNDLYYWARIGADGELERFDTLPEAIDYLNAHSVGMVWKWQPAGFSTPNYWGTDYVRLFVGDLAARVLRGLGNVERRIVEGRLTETYV